MEEIKPVTIIGKQAAKYIGISYWLTLDLAKKVKFLAYGLETGFCSGKKLLTTGCKSRNQKQCNLHMAT